MGVAAAYVLLILLLERNAYLSLPLIANWYMHMLFASLLGARQFVHSGSHRRGVVRMSERLQAVFNLSICG